MGCRDVLLPKSQDEIWEAIQELSPDEMLSKCVRGGFLPGVIVSIKNGANIGRISIYNNNVCATYLAISVELGFTEIANYLIDQNIHIIYADLEIGVRHFDLLIRMLEKYNIDRLSIDELHELADIARNHRCFKSSRYLACESADRVLKSVR